MLGVAAPRFVAADHKEEENLEYSPISCSFGVARILWVDSGGEVFLGKLAGSGCEGRKGEFH